MSLRTKDWEHRLQVLWAWRQWRHKSQTGDEAEGATYRAVLDGCAVTVRALCDIVGVFFDFKDRKNLPHIAAKQPQRRTDMLKRMKRGGLRVNHLTPEEQRCLVETLYLGNRCVAHPKDGAGLDHKAGATEMTGAINVVLKWLRNDIKKWSELNQIPKKHYLEPIP